jgi:hypothetical protein
MGAAQICKVSDAVPSHSALKFSTTFLSSRPTIPPAIEEDRAANMTLYFLAVLDKQFYNHLF